MITATRTQVIGNPLLLLKVDNDPRVVAARKAKEAFFASEEGQKVSGVVSYQALQALPQDVKERLDAVVFNYHRTRLAVRNELIEKAKEGN